MRALDIHDDEISRRSGQERPRVSLRVNELRLLATRTWHPAARKAASQLDALIADASK
jgi:hypothetical protein